MSLNAGELCFPRGTDVTLTQTIIGVRADISGTGQNWTFKLTVRLDASDADPSVHETAVFTLDADGDADTDPVISITIADDVTDGLAVAVRPAKDGFPEHTHVWDVWRTNANSESQLVRGTFRVTEPVRTVV